MHISTDKFSRPNARDLKILGSYQCYQLWTHFAVFRQQNWSANHMSDRHGTHLPFVSYKLAGAQIGVFFASHLRNTNSNKLLYDVPRSSLYAADTIFQLPLTDYHNSTIRLIKCRASTLEIDAEAYFLTYLDSINSNLN